MSCHVCTFAYCYTVDGELCPKDPSTFLAGVIVGVFIMVALVIASVCAIKYGVIGKISTLLKLRVDSLKM